MTHHDHEEHSHSHCHQEHHHNHSHHHHHHEHEEKSHSHHLPSDSLSLNDKFVMLLKSWIEHNNSHKESYTSWANKAKESKDGDLAEVAKFLEETAKLSEAITENLQKALKSIKN